MEQIFISIILGILVGYLNFLKYKTKKVLSFLATFSLFIMLWCLGAKIGCDDVLLANLGLLGLKSIYIALGIIIGSLTLLWLLTRWFSDTSSIIEEGK